MRPQKWEDSQVRFRGSDASGRRIVLLPGAFWAHGASKMAILGASFLLCILQCFRVWEGMLPPGACRMSHASARRIVSCRGLCVSSLCSQIPLPPAPTLVAFRLNHYILNQDTSKWHFQRTMPSRWRFPCVIASERAVRIDISSANFTAKSHFWMSPFKMFPFRVSWTTVVNFGVWLSWWMILWILSWIFLGRLPWKIKQEKFTRQSTNNPWYWREHSGINSASSTGATVI